MVVDRRAAQSWAAVFNPGEYVTKMKSLVSASALAMGVALAAIPTVVSAQEVCYTTAAGGSYSGNASGLDALACGSGSTASGSYTTAIGDYATASSLAATATGSYSTASGAYSTAGGFVANATGTLSSAYGARANATGNDSTAI